MKSPYKFIVSPIGDNYINSKKVDGGELITNTSLESHKHVNREAEVVSVPIYYKGDIKPGDKVIVHHNVFRIYYDMKGRQTKSPEFFRDGLYLVDIERIFLYNQNGEWKSNLHYCFVSPVDNFQDDVLYDVEKEQKHTGILVYPSKRQVDENGLYSGQLIGFTKNSEYEFNIDGKKLYRMHDRDVILKFN